MSTNLGKSLEGCLKERSVTFREYNMVAGLLSFFTVAVGCTARKARGKKEGARPSGLQQKKAARLERPMLVA